jgi:3-methyladenine DNA glycosylase/8-oxoguanine DNA glycosylase
MTITKFNLQVIQPFDFRSVLQSHGWVDLLPNIYHAETHAFSRIEELPSGKVVQLEVSTETTQMDFSIRVAVQHSSRLSANDQVEIERNVRHMLRLDEDFSDFYILCAQHGSPWSEILPGKGRLLRSPDLFEDMVKVICTTNIQWGGTKRMVKELVDTYGKPFPANPDLKSFPKAAVIASESFKDFQSKLRLGYRASYIHTLAQDFVNRPQFFKDLQDTDRPSGEIRKNLLAIKGIGNYAAASILMLLGRYDEIPVDSVFQQMMREKYFNQQDFALEDALAIYYDWGKWKYLAYWFDLLKFYTIAEK